MGWGEKWMNRPPDGPNCPHLWMRGRFSPCRAPTLNTPTTGPLSALKPRRPAQGSARLQLRALSGRAGVLPDGRDYRLGPRDVVGADPQTIPCTPPVTSSWRRRTVANSLPTRYPTMGFQPYCTEPATNWMLSPASAAASPS